MVKDLIYIHKNSDMVSFYYDDKKCYGEFINGKTYQIDITDFESSIFNLQELYEKEVTQV